MLDLRIADAFLKRMQYDLAVRFGMEVDVDEEVMAISAWHIEDGVLVQQGYLGEGMLEELYRVLLSNPETAEPYEGVDTEEFMECIETLLLWDYAHEPGQMPNKFFAADAAFTEYVPDPTLGAQVH